MTRTQLKENLDEAEWSWLKPHVMRDAVVIVHPQLDLVHVADAIANNQVKQVEVWLSQGLLTKPTAEQIKEWDQIPSKRFISLIVQPYVLIQELLMH
jgi:hypothetical protein